MSWIYTAATIMVDMAVVLRLLGWAYGRAHQPARQQPRALRQPRETRSGGQQYGRR